MAVDGPDDEMFCCACTLAVIKGMPATEPAGGRLAPPFTLLIGGCVRGESLLYYWYWGMLAYLVGWVVVGWQLP